MVGVIDIDMVIALFDHKYDEAFELAVKTTLSPAQIKEFVVLTEIVGS